MKHTVRVSQIVRMATVYNRSHCLTPYIQYDDYNTRTSLLCCSYIAYATDKGSPQMTGTTGIDILYTEVTTTSTAATTTEYNFFDHGGNVALFVITLLLGLALLAVITWCLVTRYCNRNPCCELSDICRDRRRRRP